ncbi:MAG TPA: YecA family protein [Crenotrichaceae bacterium]|nr:YecA family protein [Crenotrichaceae bacterium]
MEQAISQLINLGEVKPRDEWLDYLQFGLNQNDVPELIKIIEDLRHNWAALHAWRALGQIGNPQAIQPLLNQFSKLCDDDWAISELCIVMGMIGQPAIEALGNYLKDKRRKEYARIMASDSLAQIVVHHPETRDTVLDVYHSYLSNPDHSAVDLNGLLISQLIDLKTTELIDEISALFQANAVDIQICGDFEDVQIAMGLLQQRKTPKPDYRSTGMKKLAETMQMLEKNKADDGIPGNYQRIDHYLDRYGSDESILCISELDGYFSAIVCAPEMILPSQWMLGIWGGEEFSPEWESVQHAQEFNSLILNHYNEVLQSFQNDFFSPLYLEGQFEGKTTMIVDEWCTGFWRGYLLWLDEENKNDPVTQSAVHTIYPFATEKGFEILEILSKNEIISLQKQIEPAVIKLYQRNNASYLQSLKKTETFKRNQPKVGRNEPCPCGSGKKYKKCCLH